MPDAALLALLLLIALAIGVLLAAALAQRRRAALLAERDALRGEAERWRTQCSAAGVDLAGANARAAQAETLRAELAEVRGERETARQALAAAAAVQAERDEAHARAVAALAENREALATHFSDIGGKLLGEAQKAFLERADQRFAQHGEKSELQLKALLTPVESTLKRYDEKLGEIEKARVGSYAALDKAITDLTHGNETVRRETQRLANVMRSSPKARGRWGEEQLRTILEAAGLAENVDFSLQSSVSDGERQLRPDCVIHLPNQRCIVVDVKCPLVHFEQAFDEEDEARRGELLLAHAGAMRSYATDLGKKSYWRQFDLSPDFVIMFIPGEHFLSAAAERAPELIEQAFKCNVIIASTINMLALAKVMAGLWRQEALATQAAEIGALGKELHARLATMGSHVHKLGRNLNLATGAYNDFVGSLESNVMTSARRFEALKVETGGKPIELLPVVDVAVRPLRKLSGSIEEPAEAAE